MSWYFVNFNSVARRDDFPKIIIQQTRELPFPDLGVSDVRPSKTRISRLVAQIQQLYSQLASVESDAQRKMIDRQIASADAAIDQLVFSLYGLTPEEISLVEK